MHWSKCLCCVHWLIADELSSYGALVGFLRSPETLRVALKCLQRVHIRSGGNGRVHVKVFLGALLIERFPVEVFRLATEPRLIEATRAMLLAFDAGSRDFPSLLETYMARLREWRPAERVQQRIKNALRVLYVASAQEPLSPQTRTEFEEQIARLRARLDAETLREFDAQLEVGPTIFRTTVGVGDTEQIAHELMLDPAFTLACPPQDDEFHEVLILCCRIACLMHLFPGLLGQCGFGSFGRTVRFSAQGAGGDIQRAAEPGPADCT